VFDLVCKKKNFRLGFVLILGYFMIFSRELLKNAHSG